MSHEKNSNAVLSAMYQDMLLAHYRRPLNRRKLDVASGTGTRSNPLCGDAISVEVFTDGEQIADVAFSGRGCSIAVASSSMMTEAVRGHTVAAARALAHLLDGMLAGDPAVELPETLRALRGVALFPGRHGCAAMPWHALRSALE